MNKIIQARRHYCTTETMVAFLTNQDPEAVRNFDANTPRPLQALMMPKRLAAYLVVCELGFPAATVARGIGVTKQAISKWCREIESSRDDPAVNRLLDRAAFFMGGDPPAEAPPEPEDLSSGIDCLLLLLSQPVRLRFPRGPSGRTTVLALLRRLLDGTITWQTLRPYLQEVGLVLKRPVTSDEPWYTVVVPNQSQHLVDLFADTQWQADGGAATWARDLRKVPGAMTMKQGRIGGRESRGVTFKVRDLIRIGDGQPLTPPDLLYAGKKPGLDRQTAK